MALVKTKKPAAKKITAAPKKTTAKTKAAKPSTKAASTKAKAPQEILAIETFAKFGGYRTAVDKDEAVFDEGEIIYIVEVDADAEEGVMYNAIKASDISEWQENGDENVVGGQVAASEIIPLKGGALTKAAETYMPVAVIGRLAEMLEEHGGDAIDVAIDLNRDIQETYFWLGGALAKVLQEGKYLTDNGGTYEGDDAFNEFCQSEFGFKASKGRQLARIYSTFSSIPDFEAEKLAGIGWSIAAKIEKYVTPENVDDVIDAASDDGVTQRTVDSVMREKFVAGNTTPSGKSASRDTVKFITMNFRLGEDSGETVRLALNQCMKQNGISETEAIERICVEWAQDHVQAKTVQSAIARKAKKSQQARESETKPAAEPKAKTAPRTRKAA